MSLLHRIMALVILAVWMPAVSLCLAECAGLVERGDCCPAESSGGSDAAASPCCLLASGHYKSHDYRPLVIAPAALSAAQVPSLISVAPTSEDLAPLSPSPSPPDLPVTWQFSFRAALLPRAPSLAS